tara:strand:- start:4637 stop:4753 length:117 start_codon:yes stop_codon:yes gene_type:complete
MALKKVKSKCTAKMKKSFSAGMNIGRNMKKPKTPKKKK